MGSKNNSRKPANDGFSAPAVKNAAGNGKKTGISVICMVLVLALCAGVIIYTKVADSGFFYRTTVSISSENYEVNNAMLSYFFNSQYQNMSSTLEQMGVDLTKNLKDQKYTSDLSWYDYLMQNVTIPNVEQILVLCEAAKAAGFELDEHEMEHVDEAVESIEAMAKSYASAYGGSENYYIRNVYGYGINIKDIRAAIELNQLAAAYSEKLVDSYEYTEEEWDAYLEEHRDDFLVVDYVTYTFEAEEEEEEETTSADTTAAETEAETTGVAGSASDGTTEATTAEEEEEEELSEEKKAARALANQLSQQMMAQPDKALEIFNTEVKKHLEEVVYADEEDAEKKAESVQTDLDATVVEAVENDETSDFMKFVFDDEREDMTFVTDDDKNGRYTVYLITKEPYIEEYVTRNLRIIALSAASGETIADERDSILEDFEAGEKTEEAFIELAKTHSDDSTAHENGGLYENQGKTDLGVDELNEWLFAEDRKVGDYTSVSNGESSTSEVIYIAYYTGEGMIKWQRDVDSALTSEEYDADFKKLEEAHAVTTDLNNAYKIPAQAGLS